MVGELAARHVLSKEVIEGVSVRTGGVPLFVEEVTRLLLERGDAGGLQAIPPTLQQSLAARLDRLGRSARKSRRSAPSWEEIHLFAAPRGRRRRRPRPTIRARQARRSGPPHCRGPGREASYRFKHVLIQDAAYDSLLKSRRQALHRRAAEILCDNAERAAGEPEVSCAPLYAGWPRRSRDRMVRQAGDQALRRSAFQEAIAHLGKAIAMADQSAGGKVAGASGERGRCR